MRSCEFLIEGTAHPCIVVDVQPEYCGIADGDENPVCVSVIDFINKRTGPVLMFVNAEKDQQTGDTITDIKRYWEDSGFDPKNWARIELVDKGYGYFRSWMDRGTSDRTIIRVIREMYRQKVDNTLGLYGGELDLDYDENMKKLIGSEFRPYDLDDPLYVNLTSVAQLRRYNGAYIMGGARYECLREVEILMNAFNIKYKRIDSLVYG